MAYDEVLAERVRTALAGAGVAERRMFGALGFMFRGRSMVMVHGDDLMVRVGRDGMDEATAKPGARAFEFRGRESKGWVLVAGEVLDDEVLGEWLDLGMAATAELPPK